MNTYIHVYIYMYMLVYACVYVYMCVYARVVRDKKAKRLRNISRNYVVFTKLI